MTWSHVLRQVITEYSIHQSSFVDCMQGSGKTAAFLIPILSKLMGKAKKLCAPRPNPATFISGETPGVRAEPLVLIVAPCRELATQIFDEARRFCYRSMLRPAVVYGGGPIAEQIRQLEKGCDVLIGTPGRLCDFINRPHLLTLRRLKYMVIDEADEMLNTDWEAELKQIMSGGDQEEGNIKYLMFSATFPKMARELATQHLAHNHVRIHVGRAGSSHQNIKQDVIFVEPHLKKQALLDLLLSAPPARTIIFVNSKRAADEADDFLFNNNIPCTSIHAGRTQREREDSIRAFRSGKTPVLIATGVSARGLDIHKVMHVVNFDLPSAQYGGIQEYTHRIGRTGRIGNLGLATSFYDPRRDADIAEPLVKLMLETRQVIPDFLREFLPEGFTTDDDGNVTGDFAGLKFEDADEEDNAEGGCDGWGTDAQAAAPTETSDWATEKSQAAPIQATPAPVAPSLSSGDFGASQGPPAPPSQFGQQTPTQSNWGVPSAPAPVPAASVTQHGHGAPFGSGPQYVAQAAQYGGSQYGSHAPRNNGQGPQYSGQPGAQYGGQPAQGFAAPLKYQQYGDQPAQPTHYANSPDYGSLPSVPLQNSAPAANRGGWGAPVQNVAPRNGPAPAATLPPATTASNVGWDHGATW
ncbi:hypothetical protein ONS95_001702 [Cadophora gregata]|uniref:uncharacterized protein n=1 Tax=Cadophora gregata TaxID=51156 RepID=UPI0026DCFADF|nr:uncharacterized protein ONS95_001702 [Cadophora gregata]KAK0111338.1 hypothetical protein ONS95_001702 [Cadophora gregata]